MYLIKFTPGFSQLAARQLRKSTQVVVVQEDILLVEAAKLPPTPYAADVFRVLGNYTARTMDELLHAAARDHRVVAQLRGVAQGDVFRVRCMIGDENARVDVKLLNHLEHNIMRAGLILQRDFAQRELRLWLRTDHHGLLLMKLDKETKPGKPSKGMLRSDLCHMLCLMARVTHEDRCLDPFCGSGALAAAMAQYSPNVDAADIDPIASKTIARNVRFHRADALSESLPAHLYSLILTDPPWGIYRPVNRSDFYAMMFYSFRRLLKEDGRCILLLERDLNIEPIAFEAGFELQERYDALYAGHKIKALRFAQGTQTSP